MGLETGSMGQVLGCPDRTASVDFAGKARLLPGTAYGCWNWKHLPTEAGVTVGPV